MLAAISAMPEEDRTIAKGIHEIVRETAPELTPRMWYGTFGFEHQAHLDKGDMWPVAFAVKALSSAERTRIADLVKLGVS